MLFSRLPRWKRCFFLLSCLTLFLALGGFAVITALYRIGEDGPVPDGPALLREARTRLLACDTNSRALPPAGGVRVWLALYNGKKNAAFPGSPYLQQQMETGKTVNDALSRAVADLLYSPYGRELAGLSPAARKAALDGLRIKLDVLTKQGPVASLDPFVAGLSFLYGIDGVTVQSGAAHYWVLPSEIVEAGIPELVKGELRAGLDLSWLARYLQRKSGGMPLPRAVFSRFRTHSWIECGPDKTGMPVYRGNILIPYKAITSAMVRDGFLAAVDNLAACVETNGRFRYLYYPVEDRHAGGDYSLPRHAGALWMLYQAEAVQRSSNRLAAAERGLSYFLKATGMMLLPDGLPRHNLYDLAIGLLAVMERRAVSGATNLDAAAVRIADAIVRLQDARGMFHYGFPVKPKLSPRKGAPYAPGEAMLALGKAHAVFGKAAWRDAVVRGMRFIVDEAWSFFGSRLFYGFYAWEMQVLAAHRDWLAELERFSYDQADSYLNYQYTDTTPETRDLLGAFHETVLRVPKAAHAGARGEGIVASYRLAGQMGKKRLEQRYKDSIRIAVSFILNQQVRQENSWYYPRPELALGAIRYMPSYHELRIDHTQHCAAVLLAAFRDGLFP